MLMAMRPYRRHSTAFSRTVTLQKTRFNLFGSTEREEKLSQPVRSILTSSPMKFRASDCRPILKCWLSHGASELTTTYGCWTSAVGCSNLLRLSHFKRTLQSGCLVDLKSFIARVETV